MEPSGQYKAAPDIRTAITYAVRSNTVIDYPHRHTQLVFTYVIRGRIAHNVNGRQSILSDGDFFVIDTNSWHACLPLSAEIEVINIMFSPSLFSPDLPDDAGVAGVLASDRFMFPENVREISVADQVFHDSNLEIFNLFSEVLSEDECHEPGWQGIIRSGIARILLEIVRKKLRSEPPDTADNIILQVKSYITIHYVESISLSDICRKLGYSLAYVSHKFSMETGMTFSEYLQNERIDRSRALLLCTNLPIDKICEKVGYHNTTFFFRIFKKITGLSPNEYRSLNRCLPGTEQQEANEENE